jgi:hypothetical protein
MVRQHAYPTELDFEFAPGHFREKPKKIFEVSEAGNRITPYGSATLV